LPHFQRDQPAFGGKPPGASRVADLYGTAKKEAATEVEDV